MVHIVLILTNLRSLNRGSFHVSKNDKNFINYVLALEKVKNSEALQNLVKLLAFQIGQPVSHHELATQLRIDTKTVSRYIDLLEKSFIIHKLRGFSRNLRNEITSKNKYYFYDLGIRNAAIAQLNPLEMRNDVEHLWENFIFIERVKKCSYHNFYGNRYFWRTYDGKEIDFVEEVENNLSAFEVKWSETKKPSAPISWRENYPSSSFEVITPANYFNYIL